VVVSVVDFVVVTFSFSAFGTFTFAALVDFEDFVDFLGAVKSELSSIPDMEMVDPLTAVTFPVPMASLEPEKKRRAPAPPPNEPRAAPLPPAAPPPAPPPKPPPEKPPAPPGAPVPAPVRNRPAPAPAPVAHVPDADAGEMTMDLAAIVVLDFLAGVPVTVRQSPTATELTVSVTVLEKVVVAVQLTVVWPADGLCTSMEVPAMEATLPLAIPPRAGGGVAAPALAEVPTRPTRPTTPTRPAATPPRRVR
jgi:hypothetical protein